MLNQEKRSIITEVYKLAKLIIVAPATNVIYFGKKFLGTEMDKNLH